MGKKQASPPAAPDPTVVAGAQSAANIASATAQQKLNMVNSSDPYGSVNYTADPSSPGGYRQTTSLSPEQQALYDRYTGLQQNALGTAGTALGGVDRALAGGLTPPQLGTSAGFDQRAADAVYNQGASRLDPQWNLAEDRQRTRLANQGFSQNDTGYANSMGQFGRDRNDAYTSLGNQATLTGANLGLQQGQFDNTAAQQGFQNQAYAQNQPLNQFNALLSSGQVGSPQGINYTPAQVGQTDVTGAYGLQQAQLNANYQSKLAQQQNGLGGLFNLGSAAITKFSDARLKRDIVRIGTRPDGLGAYAFKYIWDDVRRFGVMAQEVLAVKPEAVREVGGFLTVDYGML